MRLFAYICGTNCGLYNNSIINYPHNYKIMLVGNEIKQTFKKLMTAVFVNHLNDRKTVQLKALPQQTRNKLLLKRT